MIDQNQITAIIRSVQALDETGMLDPAALKQILKEHIAETAESFENIQFLESIFNFMLDLLVKKSIVTAEEKDHYIKNLEILYSDTDNKINSTILDGKGEYTDEEKEIIVDSSTYKGKFETYESLLVKFPPHKSKHGWTAIVWPNPDKVEARKINDVKLYTFDIRENGWILTIDRTVMPNFMERVDTDIPGREKGSPLEGDFFVYKKNKERVLAYTRDELDIASRKLQQFHIASLISTKIVRDRLELNTKEVVEAERDERLNKDNLYYKDLAENCYNMSYEEISNIVKQINEDYEQKIEVVYEKDSLGINRPRLFRTSNDVNELGGFLEDYDEYGLVRKNVDNYTIDELVKLINKDFNRKMGISYDKERVLEILGEMLETTMENDMYVPRNMSKFEFNKLIKQVNDDYLNVIDYINKRTYNIVKDLFVDSMAVSSDEKTAIKNRLNKADTSKVYDTYKTEVDYKENTKNKNIQMKVVNDLLDKINELELKIDVNRDEIFERVNRYNADKSFTDNVNIDKNLIVALDTLIRKNLEVLGDVVIKGNIQVEGTEIYFSNIQSITKIDSVNTVIKDKMVEVNKPSTAIGSSDPIYNDWSKKVGNGAAGLKAFRGNNTSSFFMGFEEARSAPVAGFISEETESHIRENTFKIAMRDDIMAAKKPVRYNAVTDRLETTDELNADLNGSIYTEYLLDKTKIDSNVDVSSPVRIDSTGKIILAKADTLANADMFGVVRKLDVIDSNRRLIQINLFGKMSMNISGAIIGDTVYLDESGLLVTEINKANDEAYIVKEVGKILDNWVMFLRPVIAINYSPVVYRKPEESANYSSEKVILNGYFTDSQYGYMKPVGADSDEYSEFSIAVHGINGLSGFIIKNQTGDKILADNGTIVDISSVYIFTSKLNDSIYLTSSNTLTFEKTNIEVGKIVGVGLMRVNIQPELIVAPTNVEPVVINAVVNEKQDLQSGAIYKIPLEEDSVVEFISMDPGTPYFNKLNIIRSSGKTFIGDITICKNMGNFCIVNNEDLYYKPVVNQKSVYKYKLIEVAYLDPASVKEIYQK